MIVIDTSAVVAIARDEPNAAAFADVIAAERALIGTPTAFELAMVLSSAIPDFADAFLKELLDRPSIRVVDFSANMFWAASQAFGRFGKGRGHPAGLNFGDCMSYAVAQVHDLPLLYQGDDFRKTDIRSALTAARFR